METHIKIDNLKCGGCANSIENGLTSMKGVNKVKVLTDTNEVIVDHTADANLEEIKEKLKHLGYPETGTTEGFEKFARNMKSYVSCAIGRLGPKHEDEAA